ncbi:DUF4142 domain-containing protein [Nitrosomonas sp. Is37]|uniref:DUF4142 domain-containing protein n=1 Tax=Nitrosomonas sp. Is37 TaxID=3080535 RepID=UPI00294AA9BF|nr:DUF4142 domain-containing protein [Nitrosomonas sp. Is37]MDV6344054.1 DUF4142 domain-containing protein [Nitrosomonas sp. Is37]
MKEFKKEKNWDFHKTLLISHKMEGSYEEIYIYAIALILPAFNAFAGMFNDEQIVAIVQAFNKAEIGAGDLARSTSNHSETRRFGHRMVGEHYGANWLINDLVQKEKISPENSETSESLKTNEEKHLEKLKGLRGPAFDLAYSTIS